MPGPYLNAPPWIESQPARRHPQLRGEVRADVAVVGAGITGITLARLLAAQGASVALIEADRLGFGVSCFTTAKLSALQATAYQRLRSRFGSEAATVYATANQQALGWIEEQIELEEIECSFRHRPALTYAADEEELAEVEKEADAAAAAGLAVEARDDPGLPFEVAGAVLLAGQAEFDPYAYLTGLAASLQPPVSIFEGSRVESISAGSPCRVRTGAGSVLCERVVLATLTPILDRSLAFARTHPQRSYCLAFEAGEPAVDGMMINAGSPVRSLRSHPTEQGEVLIVGGEGHKVGQTDRHGARYEELERFARHHFDVGAEVARWSAQDFVSADGAPLIGAVNPLGDRVLMATGYGKWGLTTGTAAAQALAATLAGGSSPFGDAFDANRLKPLAAGASLLKENANVGFHFFADRIPTSTLTSEDLGPDEGAIVGHPGRRAAAYRDSEGELHTVSPICTHLRCLLRFNDAERSWDCPCHGSRFGVDGEVLQGPATEPLPPR